MINARLLIWCAAPIHEVRAVLHRYGMRSVLVEVESGTVVVPRDQMSLSVATQWGYKVTRKTHKAAVVFAWDDQAMLILPVAAVAFGWSWGDDKAAMNVMAQLADYGRARKASMALLNAVLPSRQAPDKQARAAKRIAEAMGVDEATVRPRVQQYEHRLPPEQLLDELGKGDVATVVRAVDAGHFDGWRAGRNKVIEWKRRYNSALLIAVALGGIVGFTVALMLPFLGVGPILLGPAFGILVLNIFWQWTRYRIRQLPIDEVLPIVQLPSDNQSAR
ncbi:hypothetical protein [Kibdelosporangium aridum]|uniref:Uncharacterized protein n=1 Tax=Kibdelosporangium aridum TaxID=2030 RepID=A0A1W2DGC7_KIBAR|nr:hypothetical protein [Kibdelosporangium aridum]SMC96533.1 hypothetical protein SAMN05661093_03312 [Kibdelosporangium aridum]